MIGSLKFYSFFFIVMCSSSNGLLAEGLLPESISAWANVYISNDVDNRYISDHPSGNTVASEPVLKRYCYKTDGRSSTNDPDASSRIHAKVSLQLLREEPWIEETDRKMRIGETFEYRCASTEVTCNGTGTFDEDEIELSRDGHLVKILFNLASGNPCSFFAKNLGAIDFEVTLTIDLLKREFSYEGKLADFPNYEFYLKYDDDEPITVIDYRVSEDSSPASLLGKARKIVSGKGTID